MRSSYHKTIKESYSKNNALQVHTDREYSKKLHSGTLWNFLSLKSSFDCSSISIVIPLQFLFYLYTFLTACGNTFDMY